MAYITMREFAARYNIPIATVYGWSAGGKLPEPDEIVGKTKRWREEVLRDWLKNYHYRTVRERNADGHESA